MGWFDSSIDLKIHLTSLAHPPAENWAVKGVESGLVLDLVELVGDTIVEVALRVVVPPLRLVGQRVVRILDAQKDRVRLAAAGLIWVVDEEHLVVRPLELVVVRREAQVA